MSEILENQVSAGKVLDNVQLKSFSITDEKLEDNTYSLMINMEVVIPVDRFGSTFHFVVFNVTDKTQTHHTFIRVNAPDESEGGDPTRPGVLKGKNEIRIEDYDKDKSYHLYVSNIMPENFEHLDIADIQRGAIVESGIPTEEFVVEGE